MAKASVINTPTQNQNARPKAHYLLTFYSEILTTKLLTLMPATVESLAFLSPAILTAQPWGLNLDRPSVV